MPHGHDGKRAPNFTLQLMRAANVSLPWGNLAQLSGILCVLGSGNGTGFAGLLGRLMGGNSNDLGALLAGDAGSLSFTALSGSSGGLSTLFHLFGGAGWFNLTSLLGGGTLADLLAS